MATYLAVPLKRTWEVDLVKPLRTFIADTYSNANPEEYNNALQEFNKLRANMIAKSVDKHESAVEVLCRYHDQLIAMESKLPIAENQIRINFKWQDAFDKESFFSGRRTLTIASGTYEKVCIMFNIAALQSQVAECQNHTTDEGLKLAAKLFQQGSGIYSHMKDCVLSQVQGEPTPDLHPDTLGALSALMLAQGQDCFCRKSISDKMKPQIIAKLCHQASDLYAEAMKLLQLESIRTLWPKDWIPSAASKQAAFHSLAEYFQSQQHATDKEFGEQIARLKHAKELMAAAETRGGYTFIFEDYFKKIYRALEEAEKDNNFIYHAKIPEQSALPAIGKAAVAKQTAYTQEQSSNFQDLFEKVVPLAVHQSMMAFESRKAEVVNTEVGRLREATQTMNGILASLNLPAALEDLSGAKVPQSLLEKSATLKEKGGYDHLNRLITELPELLTRNKEILDESEKMLNEEASSDQQLKAQFKERWTRTPSEQLTQGIRAEASKYRTIINNAISADSIVREKFGKHSECIELLSKTQADIDRALPSGSSAAALQGSPVVQTLRRHMEEVETIKAERDAVEAEIKDAKCDLSSKFTLALAQDGAINEESLSMDELDRIYTPLRQQVSESLRRQEALLGQVQQSNDQFSSAKAQGTSGVSREQKLKDFAAAFDSFMELKNNLEEGTKFYNDLTQLLVKFQSKVNDFCFARKTEKEELMKDLSSSIARQSSAPPPSQPTYQQPTQPPAAPNTAGNKKNTPPARPPPPTLPAQNAAASAPAATAPAPAVPQYGAPQGYSTQPPYTGQQPPYPTNPSLPYPVYPPAGGYAPMPGGYNPYGGYGGYPAQQPPPPGYPQQAPPPQGQYPQQQQQYPGYPPQGGYPPQQGQRPW